MHEYFRRFAQRMAAVVGSPWAFFAALLLLLAWGASGPLFGFTDTWQLVINTGTTIVTFLMVFLIQNTQNRDAKAIHLKLDELLRAMKGARNALIDLEDLSDAELHRLETEFRGLREKLGETGAQLHERVAHTLERRGHKHGHHHEHSHRR